MQTKSSYRVLNWTLLAATVASLATACVVTTSGDVNGDGGETSTTFGGEPATTAGKTSGGETTAAGKTSTGGGGSGSGGMVAMTGGETSASGGEPAVYVPGVCDGDTAVPSMVPACAPAAVTDACNKCLQTKCCEEWKACNSTEPMSACAAGAKAGEPGQFDCMTKCFADGAMDAANANDLLAECAGKCTLQCDATDNGNPTQATNDLVGCANDAETGCQTECFPF